MRTDVVLHYHFVTLRIIADLSEPYSLGSMIKSIQDPAPNSAVLVGLGGLEPPTSRLSGVRSNHLSYRPEPLHGEVGGARRIRTDDPLRAKQVLSQLSYSPVCWSCNQSKPGNRSRSGSIKPPRLNAPMDDQQYVRGCGAGARSPRKASAVRFWFGHT